MRHTDRFLDATEGGAMPNVKPIPDGYHSVTPYLVINGAERALDFYKAAFNAREIMRMPTPEGKIGHAEIRIGDSVVMVADETPRSGLKSPQSLGGTTVGVFLYVEDVDAIYDRAVAAGARATSRPQDMFWGDRYGKLTDPFGHEWSIATHKEDLSEEEMTKRAAGAMAGS
jgi:PhnB protein